MTRQATYIKLDQFMKLVGMAATGGQAKQMVQAGLVSVNGAVETRRGRKLRSGDVVATGDAEAAVDLPNPEVEPPLTLPASGKPRARQEKPTG